MLGKYLILSTAKNSNGLPPIGSFFEGGYYAGQISHTADGNPTHALIVSPRASGSNGMTRIQWKGLNTSTPGTGSLYDGLANTNNMADASHPAAYYCAGLTINGYSDWYLPARYELDIAYYHLKPDSNSNNTSWGINSWAVPPRMVNYTSADPGQTTVARFRSGGSEAFPSEGVWSSTESNATNAWELYFDQGIQSGSIFKNNISNVRAFRRIPI